MASFKYWKLCYKHKFLIHFLFLHYCISDRDTGIFNTGQKLRENLNSPQISGAATWYTRSYILHVGGGEGRWRGGGGSLFGVNLNRLGMKYWLWVPEWQFYDQFMWSKFRCPLPFVSRSFLPRYKIVSMSAGSKVWY